MVHVWVAGTVIFTFIDVFCVFVLFMLKSPSNVPFVYPSGIAISAETFSQEPDDRKDMFDGVKVIFHSDGKPDEDKLMSSVLSFPVEFSAK